MPSTVIRSYRYEITAGDLHVMFQSGRHYVYHDVPFDLYEQMQAAFSKGEFFNANVRDRFEFTRRK